MRDAEALAATYTDADFHNSLIEAFSLSRIAHQSYSTAGIERLSAVADAIQLTAAGEAACSAAEIESRRLDPDELKVAAFLSFYWSYT